MIYVVVKETNEILKRFEAWAKDSYTEARKYIKDNGYVPLKEEITTMGDMVIWVA